MKVIFRTDGGEGKGLGHLSRCLALAREFQDRDIQVSFILKKGSTGVDYLQDQGVEILTIDKTSNPNLEAQQTLALSRGAEMIIVDYLDFSTEYLKGLMQGTQWIACIDDQMNIPLPVDIVIGNGYATRAMYGFKLSEKTQLLAGTPYLPLRHEFQNLPKRMIKETIQEVLVTMGGEDSHNVTLQILEFLKKYPKKIRLNILIGAAYRHLEELQQALIDYPHPHQLFYRLKELLPLYRRSDLAITAVGMTFWELAATGMPILVIQTAKNQDLLVNYIQEEELSDCLGWYDAFDDEKVLAALKLMEEPQRRQHYSERCQKCVDGKGVMRLVRALIEIMQKRPNHL